ncbi:beta-galactosidase-like [Sitodiplosis mosellana]|uniref:beta-galactosidase-like n=1 Tax=Sitodiplosis mosellana TaxID=263140 RepID=UPI002443EB93|nr:beta-galactosidase-like [Sitodiplosis mosellana]XP_055296890.1 beta-galactosidase-like [Sitodiplosis mosellana]XP_055296901.1 beta-galactosidase-like [Sitodiplosis mosellana]
MRIFSLVLIFAAVGAQWIAAERSFRVDYENNRFLKDGQPFRFVSGSFHYFRALPQTWRNKLRTLRASGLNAVTTYVEWSLHNPRDGSYVWDGIADVEQFVRLAAEEDLLVILRPGPYICAERDMGGLPFWLLSKYPNIKLRTSDPDYLKEVGIWYEQLMPRFESLLYENGGPIILVQVENEYGAFECDNKYSLWVRDETQKYVGDKAVLFTNDIVRDKDLKCGKIENVLATLDFGIGNRTTFEQHWQLLRKYQPNGPLVNAEFYPGWFTHWQEPPGKVDPAPVAESLRYILEVGASVNFYMFFGGTNFGFTAGANYGGPGKYQADLTSYDYDAPMDETGDVTPKYGILRDVIKDFLPLPNISIPLKSPKMKIPTIEVHAKAALLSPASRQILGSEVIQSEKPLTFEEINQFSGFVLYETELPKLKKDPSILTIPTLHDRAIVTIDNKFIGVLSRENLANSLAINAGFGKMLQILVENQGRINFEIANDFKGIIGDVLLNNVTLNNWNITGFPFENATQIDELIATVDRDSEINGIKGRSFENLRSGPMVFSGTFDIDEDEIADTFVNPIKWGKGFIFVNGFNLGRYWPLVGPQITLYLPKELLRKKQNSIVVVELQRAPKDGYIKFSDKPISIKEN